MVGGKRAKQERREEEDRREEGERGQREREGGADGRYSILHSIATL